jgi:hypothetical protein
MSAGFEVIEEGRVGGCEESPVAGISKGRFVAGFVDQGQEAFEVASGCQLLIDRLSEVGGGIIEFIQRLFAASGVETGEYDQDKATCQDGIFHTANGNHLLKYNGNR